MNIAKSEKLLRIFLSLANLLLNIDALLVNTYNNTFASYIKSHIILIEPVDNKFKKHTLTLKDNTK